MLLSEARAMRAEILALRRHAPAHKGARGLSREVMRAINNQREDVAVLIGGAHNLAKDYEIDEHQAERMRTALARAYEEDADERHAEQISSTTHLRRTINRRTLERLFPETAAQKDNDGRA